MVLNDIIARLEKEKQDNKELFLQRKNERENYYLGQIRSLDDVIVDEKQKHKIEEKKSFLQQSLDKERQLLSQEKEKIENIIHIKLHLVLELKTQGYEIRK